MHFTPFAFTPTDAFIPLGTVTTLASVAAWSLPTSNQIKEGWALCNGLVYPAGCHPNFVGTRPSISDDRFLMGSVSAGLTGGVNSFPLTAGHIPQLTGSFSSGYISQEHTHGVSLPLSQVSADHGHSFTTGTVNTGHLHGGSATSLELYLSLDHVHATWGASLWPGSGGSRAAGTYSSTPAPDTYPIIYWRTDGETLGHTHDNRFDAPWAGSADHVHTGATGGKSAAHTHVVVPVAANSLVDAHTHDTLVSFGSALPTAINNKPVYFRGVHLIAVGAQNVDLPLGSILPLATNGWAAPLSSEIKEGWILCDGAAFPAGCNPNFTGNRPQITNDRFVAGFTAAGGATVGVNSYSLTSAHIPTISGTFTGVPNTVAHGHTFVGTTGSETDIGQGTDHAHGFTTGGQSEEHGHNPGGWVTTGTQNSLHRHYLNRFLLNPGTGGYYLSGMYWNPDDWYPPLLPTTTAYSDVAGTHKHQFTSGFASTGADRPHYHVSVNTGGRNAAHTHSWVASPTGGISVNHTHNTPVSFGYSIPAAINNKPKYLPVKYLMKVL